MEGWGDWFEMSHENGTMTEHIRMTPPHLHGIQSNGGAKLD